MAGEWDWESGHEGRARHCTCESDRPALADTADGEDEGSVTELHLQEDFWPANELRTHISCIFGCNSGGGGGGGGNFRNFWGDM